MSNPYEGAFNLRDPKYKGMLDDMRSGKNLPGIIGQGADNKGVDLIVSIRKSQIVYEGGKQGPKKVIKGAFIDVQRSQFDLDHIAVRNFESKASPDPHLASYTVEYEDNRGKKVQKTEHKVFYPWDQLHDIIKAGKSTEFLTWFPMRGKNDDVAFYNIKADVFLAKECVKNYEGKKVDAFIINTNKPMEPGIVSTKKFSEDGKLNYDILENQDWVTKSAHWAAVSLRESEIDMNKEKGIEDHGNEYIEKPYADKMIPEF